MQPLIFSILCARGARRWGGTLLALALALGTLGCSAGADQDAGSSPVIAVQVAQVTPGPLQQWVRTQAVLYPLHQALITPKITAPVSQFFVQRGDPVHSGELLAKLENRDLSAAAQESQGQLEAAQADYATATSGTIPADLKRAQLDLTAAKKALDNAQLINDNSERLFQQGAIPRRALEQAGLDLTNAQNAYALAQQHLQAVESVGHAQALKAAQGNLDSAQGRAAAAAAQLSYSQITSPIDGVVTDRPLYPGELATPAAPLLTIADLSHVVARAALPAEQAALLQVGDTATITAPGSDRALPARVSVVSPATDPGSTTLEVWVEAANPGGFLRLGTAVQVAILARTLPRALTVPAGAVLIDAGGAASVMVVGADHKAHQTPVELGVRDAERVQILSGVAAGATVVSVGAYGLPDQAQVKVEAPKPAAKDED